MSTKKYDRKESHRIQVRVPNNLLEEITKQLGNTPLSQWVITACKEKLASGNIR